MKSICFFSSFFHQDKIPYYIKYYIEELKKHFTEIVFLTNEKSFEESQINYLKELNINMIMFNNEGYDFGMWYKAMQKYDLSNYERVGLINDSGILFKPLDKVFEWINKNDHDYCGM